MKKIKIESLTTPSNKNTQGITGSTNHSPQYIPLHVFAYIAIIIVAIRYRATSTIPIFDFFIIFLFSLNFV